MTGSLTCDEKPVGFERYLEVCSFWHGTMLVIFRYEPIRILLNGRPISSSSNERSVPVPVSNQNIHLNNMAYNKILVDLKHLLFFFLYAISTLILKALRLHFLDRLDWTSIDKESKLLLYIFDFAPKILILFMFPLMFYFSHKELRAYWKNTFNMCCKSKHELLGVPNVWFLLI